MIDVASLERDGFGVVRGVIPAGLLKRAQDETAETDAAGIRNPLRSNPSLRMIADCRELRVLIESMLGEAAVLTRAILFDKTKARNWPVPAHRDTTIAVAERVEAPGFGPW